MVKVVAALIPRNSRLLICQRRRNALFPLKWEFPGGKVRPGESPTEALSRELAEELGIAARIGREVYRTRHRYPEYSDELELIFFAVELQQARGPSQTPPAPEPTNLAFEKVIWAEPAELREYDFLPADRELVELLSSGKLLLG